MEAGSGGQAPLGRARGADGAAQQHGGKENEELVHEPGPDELAGQDAAAFAQDPQRAQAAQFRRQGPEKAARGQFPDGGAGLADPARARGLPASWRRHDGPRRVGIGENLRGKGEGAAADDDDPPWISLLAGPGPKRGVVMAHGPGADHDGIGSPAHGLHGFPGRGPGDPPRGMGVVGDPSIQ